MPEISVVVPTYNRLETLAPRLPTLLAQDLAPSEFEVLVCDSNSTDGTAEYSGRDARRASRTCVIFRARTAGAQRRATPASTRRGARSCCSTTPTSCIARSALAASAPPSCAARHRRRRARSAGQRSRGLRVQARPSASARDRLHKPTRKTPAVALLSHRQRVGTARRSDARRALRRELYRLRSRGLGAGLSARSAPA